jgi:hypothetical protein
MCRIEPETFPLLWDCSTIGATKVQTNLLLTKLLYNTYSWCLSFFFSTVYCFDPDFSFHPQCWQNWGPVHQTTVWALHTLKLLKFWDIQIHVFEHNFCFQYKIIVPIISCKYGLLNTSCRNLRILTKIKFLFDFFDL